MKILNFGQFITLNEREEIEGNAPGKHFILDGASSAGKSSALTKLDNSWVILPVDSFYNVMFEELGIEDFGNSGKPTISEIYPGCPYKYSGPDEEGFEKAARWYMAQEAMNGRIFKEGLKDATGKFFGKPEGKDKIIYDDVQGDIIDMFEPQNRPKWILVHAPIDHTIKNVLRRGDRPLDGVLGKSYIFKYEALPTPGGVDPDHSWTAEEIKELLPQKDWVDKFIADLGIKDDGEYWIYPKKQKQGGYDVVINSRGKDGEQKTVDEIGEEAKREFNR